MTVFPGEEFGSQHQLLLTDMNISNSKEVNKKFTPKKKGVETKEEDIRLSLLTELQSCIEHL